MPAASVAQRLPAYMAGDHVIQVSYGDTPMNSYRIETFGESNARVLARTRKTGHFFRCVFAHKFLGDQNPRIL
jgi:hypothetical protein